MDKGLFPDAIEYVRATCRGKIEALPVPEDEQTIQVACDTVVVRPDSDGNGVILEKPGTRDEAYEMIKSLMGKKVKVVSVVHLRSRGKIEAFHEVSELVMRGEEEIGKEDILGYLDEVNYT